MVTTGRLALGVGLATALVLASAAPALGAFQFVDPNPLRATAVVRLGDVAAVGSNVAIGWREGKQPGQLQVALSRNGGASFLRGNGNLRSFPVAGIGRLGMSLDICNGSIWAGTAARFPGDASSDSDVLIWRRGLDGGAGQAFVTSPSASRKVRDVDIACVGSKLLAIGWIEQSGGQTRARLLLRDLGTVAPSATNSLHNLGPAVLRGGLSVAATGSRVYVAWSKGAGRSLQLKRFNIGAGADPTISPRPTVRLGTTDAVRPKLAARGQKVVLAYSDDGKLKVKRSSDAGQTFGAATVLLNVGNVTVPSFATSASVSGTRIVIEAMRKQPNSEELSHAPVRLESTDFGAGWATAGPFDNRGPRMGALQKVNNTVSRLKEAWHYDGTSLDLLRAQRETS